MAKAETEAAPPESGSTPQRPAVTPAHADARNWQALERQDWHLWILAILLMLVMAVSLLIFMFPSVFWAQEQPAGHTPQRAFFGFCLLFALALVYMLQRQATVRRLRRSLYEAQAAAVAAEKEANLRGFEALPKVAQFHDSLAMEYLRASHTKGHLAVLLLQAANATLEDMGHVSGLLRGILRPGEALFRISGNALGAILPGTPPEAAAAFGTLVQDRAGSLRAEMPVSVTVGTYPEEIATVSEFERLLRDVVQSE